MASFVKQSKSQCLDSKIVLCGYLQGGEVVHSAVSSSDFNASDFARAVLFGDSEKTAALQGILSANVLEICADGDDVCNGSFCDFSSASELWSQCGAGGSVRGQGFWGHRVREIKIGRPGKEGLHD